MYQAYKMDDVFIGTPAISSLRISTDKHILSADIRGVYNTNFDLNIAYSKIKTDSKGSIAGLGGMLCASTDTESCSVEGDIINILAKYNFTEKFSLGLQYLNHHEQAWTFDVDQEGYYNYQTPGSNMKKIFGYYRHNERLTTAFAVTESLQTSQAPFSNIIGTRAKVDKKINGFDLRVIATF